MGWREEVVPSKQEEEADEWAKEFLIPSKYDAQLSHLKSKKAVVEFAEQLGIHPGIVVGRLQHDEVIPMSWMNDLKDLFQWMITPTQQQPVDDFDQAAQYVLEKNKELYERLA